MLFSVILCIIYNSVLCFVHATNATIQCSVCAVCISVDSISAYWVISSKKISAFSIYCDIFQAKHLYVFSIRNVSNFLQSIAKHWMIKCWQKLQNSITSPVPWCNCYCLRLVSFVFSYHIFKNFQFWQKQCMTLIKFTDIFLVPM